MNSCPNKASKEWKTLVDQVGEDLSWATWAYYGYNYPATLNNVSSLKRALSIKSPCSENQYLKLAERVTKYNNKYGTAHSFTPVQVGQADLYDIDLKINYLPKKVVIKTVYQGDNSVLGNEYTKAFINNNPEVFISEGNQYIINGEVYGSYEDAINSSLDYDRPFAEKLFRNYEKDFIPADKDKVYELLALAKNQGISGVLNHIISNTNDPILKIFAKAFLDNIDRAGFLQIKFDVARDRYGNYVQDASGSYGGGIININWKRVFFNATNLVHKNGLDSGYKSIIHELVHVYTLQALRNPQTSKEKEFKNKITKAYNTLKQDAAFKSDYGLSSVEEFISEIISNPEFRGTLNIYKAGFLAKIINYIAKLFGYTKDISMEESNRASIIHETVNTFLKDLPYLTPSKGKSIYYDKANNIKPGVSELFESNPELANQVYEALGFQGNINLESNLKNTGKTEKELTDYLKNKYPEIKLNISNNPIWEQSSDIVKNQEEYNKEVQYRLKATEILLSDKAKQVFNKGKKNKWSLDKILSELVIPKEQKQIILDLNDEDYSFANFDLRESIIIALSSNYSYAVKINTAKDKIGSDYYGKASVPKQIIDRDGESVTGGKIGQYWVEFINNDGDPDIRVFDTFEEANKAIETQQGINNSTVYSNLTVPGGTNYTENEISTPLITPSIKGHAQFATNNGIGWFRSDDKTVDELKGNWIKSESELPNEFIYSGEKYFKENGEWQTKNRFIEDIETVIWRYNMSLGNERIQNKPETKTRRILEVQSDLFQKGRNKEDLTGIPTNKVTTANLFDNEEFSFELNGYEYEAFVENIYYEEENQIEPTTVYYKNGVRISKKEMQIAKEEYKKQNIPQSQNRFLQLLNKDNNWVTFFIKSIIQDSAKKGYEKVLFPKGETAARVEGHTTLENELTSINKDIEALQKDIEKTKADTRFTENELQNIRNRKQKSIDELEKRKSELKSQGIEKLKPIEAFYEIKVGNILEKQFGKENVKTITDEYGNQWREISINQSRDLDNILLQKNEANRIIGQANIKAMTVLVDAVNKKEDTIPHEYAHHYIAWFRNTPIVQEAIKRFGSEEALVQAIGEQVVKQKGEAYNWWKKFTNWILNLLSDKQLLQVLTDSFLNRQDLHDFTYNQPTIQQKQQAIEIYSKYLDTIFPDYINNFAYEAVGFKIKVNRELSKSKHNTDEYRFSFGTFTKEKNSVRVTKNIEGDFSIHEGNLSELTKQQKITLFQEQSNVIPIGGQIIQRGASSFDGIRHRINLKNHGFYIQYGTDNLQEYKSTNKKEVQDFADKYGLGKVIEKDGKLFTKGVILTKDKNIDSIASNKNVIDSFKRKMEGIDYVFSQSPELASIGSKIQYLQYLSTIFKTSKVKDIVYHGSRGDERIETFKFTDVNKLAQNVKSEDNTGIFFTDDPYIAATYGDGTFAGNYKVLLNIKNPIYPNTETVTSGSVGKYIGKYDGVIGQEPDHPGTNIVVFKPEQIHILGSKQDIEGFKEFVNKGQIKPGVSELFESNPKLANEVYEALGFKQLPKLKEGFTRFYRGETTDKTDFSKLPSWIESNAGNWWSDKETKAVEFAGYRNNAKTFYLDIPTKIVEQFRGDELSGTTNDEYLIPKEIQEKYGKYEFNSIIPQQKQQAQQVYSQYLDQIFPNSVVKDIVYHGTSSLFDNFSNNELGKTTGSPSAALGHFFTNSHKNAFHYTSTIFQVYPAYLNVIRELEKVKKSIKGREYALKIEKTFFKKLIISIENLLNKLFNSNKIVLSKKINKIINELQDLLNLANDAENFIQLAENFINKYEKVIGTYDGFFNNNSYLENLEKSSEEDVKDLIKDLKNISDAFRKVPFGYSYMTTKDFAVKNVILNINNLNTYSDKYQDYVEKGNVAEFKREETYFNRLETSFNNNYDGVIIKDSRDPLNADIYVVKDASQIHILGSKQDIDEFKEFVSNNKELQHKESNNQNVNIIEDLLPAANNNPSVGNPLQNGTRFQAVIDSYIERSKALRDSIARLKVKRKESNDPVEKANLYKRISKLQKAINEIESTDPSNPGLIKKVSQISALENIIPYAEAQLKNVRDILKADKITIEDLKYAEKIVALWIKAGDFSGREHLFWTQSELEDSENNPVLQEALKQFSRLKIEADIIKSTLINPIRENIAKKSVEEQFGKKSIPDLHKAIRDVNWGTMQALDISEVNNPLVQAMHSYLKKANFKAFTEATTIAETIDTLIKKVGKVNWDLFKQTFSNTDNRETGNLVYRFSQVFFDERSTILSNARASKNAKARAQAYKKLVKFNAEKTIIFDVRKLFPGYWNTTFTQQEIDAHIKELKDTLGEYGYNKFYEKAKENIDKYILDLESQKQIIEDNNTNNGVLNKAAYDIELANWVRENSPAAEAEIYSMTSNDINNMTFTPSGTYSVKVPRRVINGKDTGYYDKKFETIESNEDLRNLYEILFDTINELKAVLPYEDTKWMQINSLPTVYKNILDQYGEDGMSAGLNPLMDALAESSRTSDLSTTDYRYRNLATGDPDKHIQTSMMIDYNNKIKELVKLKIIEYKLENNSNPSMDQINEFKKDAANKIAQEKSFDLGKVTKMYALMALSYKHKAAIQHIMESLEHTIKNTPEIGVNPADAPLYDKNGNPIKLNGRLSNLSTMLDTFMDYYYGYKMDKPFGKTKSKIYTTEEKEKKDNLEEALELNEEKYSNKEITEAEYNSNKEVLTEMLEMLGGVRTWSKYGDMFLQYVQVKGMGWNIFAGITNMLYGFISNAIEASDGRNYDQESFWKAQSKVLRTVGGNKFTDEAIKIRSLMKKLDILKDSRYELYDSTSQSAFGKFKKKFKALNPYTPQTSTEFINQATVLVAMMIYNKVEVNGSEIPLYDCFDKNGELKEGIALPENFDLADFKIRVDKVIKLNHGNYDPDSPLNLKRQLLGRALSQFRTWSFQGFSERFMGEMYDYQLGMVRKGRYRSYVDFYKTMKDNDVGYIASTFYITKQLLRKASFGVYNTEFGEIQGLSEVDAANMRKNMTELVVLAMLTAVALLLKGLVDKDRKGPKYLAYFYLNQITRLSTDLMFYTSPSQFEKLTRNAMPAFSAVIDLEDAMAKSINYIVDNESDEIKTGVNAHKSKAFRAINKVVPNPYSGLGRVMDAAQTDYSTKPIK